MTIIEELKEVLPSLGSCIDPTDSTKNSKKEQASPCPFCGGEDRFCYWPETDSGFCRQCGWKGDSIDYQRKIHGNITMKELAMKFNVAMTPTKAKPKSNNELPGQKEKEKGRNEKIEKIQFAWKKSTKQSDRITSYFENRKINFNNESFPLPPAIKYSEFPDKDDKSVTVRSIIYAVTCQSDKTISAVQRVFIDEDNQKINRIMQGDCKGRGVWFYRDRIHEKELIVGEGAETVLSAMQATGINGVAGLDSGKMQVLQIPEHIDTLFILVDEDGIKEGALQGFAGQRASLALARRFAESGDNKKAWLITPSDKTFSEAAGHLDFNDLSKEEILDRFERKQLPVDIAWTPPDKKEKTNHNQGELNGDAGEEADNTDDGGYYTTKTLVDLAALNKTYAAVIIGGQFRIIREKFDREEKRHVIDFVRLDSFKAFFANKKGFVNSDDAVKAVSLPKLWLEWEMRRTYESIIFSPANNISKTAYNLFRGFPLTPKKGKCELFYDLLREVICDNDDASYKYVMAWMARIIQNPGGNKPGVALVLRGKKGTGKGTFVNYFSKLFGESFVPIHDARGFTGQFNMHLSRALLVFLDEALWGGDKKTEGKLKGLITEPMILLEPKGIDAIPMKSYINVIMASNEDWIVPATGDERRWCVLDVADDKMRNIDYFKAISNEMKKGGAEALYYDLLKYDYSAINLRLPPETKGLSAQIQASFTMAPELLFWQEILERGYILTDHITGAFYRSKADTNNQMESWSVQIFKHEILNEFSFFCATNKINYPPTSTKFWSTTWEFWPGGYPGRTRIRFSDGFADMIAVPALSELQKSFSKINKITFNQENAILEDFAGQF